MWRRVNGSREERAADLPHGVACALWQAEGGKAALMAMGFEEQLGLLVLPRSVPVARLRSAHAAFEAAIKRKGDA